MSRTSLHRPRRPRVVWDRPATGTRLFPCPFPPNAPLHFPHYKRCPKAHRLRLRSDQSLSRPVHVTGYGRVPGHCPACPFQRQLPDRRPSHRAQWIRPRRIQGAQISRAQAKGHHALAGLHRRPSRRTPFTRRRQSVTAPTTPPSGRAQFPLTGLHRRSPRRGHATQRRQRSPRPHISEWSGTSGGRDCPTPRLPRVSSTFLSEARGCRRAGVDVQHPLWRTSPIGTGVAVFLRKSPGPSIPSPSRFLRHSCGGRSQMRQGVNPSPEGQGPRSSGRTLPFSSRDDRPVAQGVGAPSGASTPLPTHERNRNLPCPSLLHRRLPHPRKMADNFSRRTIIQARTFD